MVISDYPDAELLANIHNNISRCIPEDMQSHIGTLFLLLVIDPLMPSSDVVGHIWGRDVSPLLHTHGSQTDEKFDVIILADLVFNHSEHTHLLHTCAACLAPQGEVRTIVSLSSNLSTDVIIQDIRIVFTPQTGEYSQGLAVSGDRCAASIFISYHTLSSHPSWANVPRRRRRSDGAVDSVCI